MRVPAHIIYGVPAHIIYYGFDLGILLKIDRKMVQELNYQGVEFPVAAKHYGKIEEQNSININVFGYENEKF